MKRKQYTEEQIIGALKRTNQARRSLPSAATWA